MRSDIENSPVNHLKLIDPKEEEFWKNLKERCLQPDLKAFSIEGDVQSKTNCYIYIYRHV